MGFVGMLDGIMDFTRQSTNPDISLVSGRGHYDTVVAAVRQARRSIWIATANLKELMVESGGRSRRSRYHSILQDFDRLASEGVDIRILHASTPSRPFRDRFDQFPALVAGGIDLRMCPRTHLKTVIVDAELAYVGSANWTGAGLGAKGVGRRNFELGFTTTDELLIDELQSVFKTIWNGDPCEGCKLRDRCELPLDTL